MALNFWCLRQCQQQSKRGVVGLGEHGAGKTTWARQLAWRLASGMASPQVQGLPDGLRPVLLRLRNLTTDDLAAGLSPLLSLRKSVPFCEQFFRELLAAGLAETREDLVQRCLTESNSFPGQVFLEV